MPPSNGSESFTLAVLPDTQHYNLVFPEVFDAQTQWLADNTSKLNLQLVAHVGDVVNESWLDAAWMQARDAMAILHGSVPYIIAPGNHDYGSRKEVENAKDRSTRLHEFFPRSLFEEMPSFGGFLTNDERVDNSYHVFEAGGEQWVVVALEFGPRRVAVDWAQQVLTEHADHNAILVTHAYLYTDGRRYDWARFGVDQTWNPHSYDIAELEGGVHDGEELWDELIAWHPNVVAVICGHAHGSGTNDPAHDGVARAVGVGSEEHPVPQLLANFQDQPVGIAGGFLRLMRFCPRTRTVEVTTYSPFLDTYKDDEENSFSFGY